MVDETQNHPDFRLVIRRIVTDVLGETGIQACEFFVERDDDGDEIINVDLCYPEDAGDPISGNTLNELTLRVRRKLLEVGDDRVPWFRHRFATGQQFRVA